MMKINYHFNESIVFKKKETSSFVLPLHVAELHPKKQGINFTKSS